jgi:ABC-type branched-subunit amino acid transport system substrate-binding protein
MPPLWNDTLPAVRDYRLLMGNERASYHGLEAYLMARTLVEGLRRAGREAPRERLIAALETLNHFDLGGYRIDYGSKHRTGSRFVELSVVGPDGKILR